MEADELMLELDPDLEEADRPLEDSLGDTSRDPLLLQMMSYICLVNNGEIYEMLKPACAVI